jgi:parvulin-like peptidyl-prolyl isomerase
VKSPFGWHIIQVEEKKPAQIATFASAHDQIKEQLTQQAQAQQVPIFLQQLRAKANIQVFDDRYKDAFPPAVPPPATSPSP